MNADWRQKLVFLFLQLSSLRQNKAQRVEVARTLSEAKNLLLCFPEKAEDLAVAENFLPLVRNSFAESAITLLLRKECKHFLRKLPLFRCVWMGQEDLTFLGLPKKDLVAQVQALDSDVAVDLSPDFDPLSAYLCWQSKAALRVSMVKPRGNCFYNLQIQSKSNNLSDNYKTLIRYLSTSC